MIARSLPAFLCASCLLVLPAPLAAQSEAQARAREHFNRGIELLDEQRYDAALAELTAAYEAVPNYAVLYNLGVVYAALGRAVEAVEAFERYLREGGDQIDPAQRDRVQTELDRQRARIASVRVTSTVPGATVSLDGVDVARTPLAEPLRVPAGTHTISVRAPGFEAVTRSVSVAGGVERSEHFELRADVGTGLLRVQARLAGVEVELDGDIVGTTPIREAIPLVPGMHRVIGRRAGYLDDEERFEIRAGGEREVQLDLEPDPRAFEEGRAGRMMLRLPRTASYLVRIDGELMTASREGYVLATGPHQLRVEAEGREPFEDDIDVPAGETFEIAPPLVWTPAERAERTGAANGQRVAGWGLLSAGVVLAGVAVPLLIWNVGEQSAANRARALSDDCANLMPSPCTGSDTPEFRHTRALNLENQALAVWIVSGIGAGLAGALLGIGLGLLLSAPSDEDIDRAAYAVRYDVRIGPGSVALDVSF